MNKPSQFEALSPHYDELMDIVPYDFWADYVMTLFHFVGHQPSALLDCACGTGNLSFELAKIPNLKVTGVDLSASMIAQAKAKAEGVFYDLGVRFVQGNLTNFELSERFDSATCLYDSLNYVTSPEDLKAAFTNIARHVSPGGIFVFDFNSVWAFEANLFTQSSHNEAKRLHYDWKATFDEATRICTVEMRFEKHLPNGETQIFTECHQERAYTRDEIENIVTNTGWEILHIFDAYTLNRPHRRSERWFFIASRL
jgi:ubiquinone/menaquinone biosynthesis C-methylase UbiE